MGQEICLPWELHGVNGVYPVGTPFPQFMYLRSLMGQHHAHTLSRSQNSIVWYLAGMEKTEGTNPELGSLRDSMKCRSDPMTKVWYRKFHSRLNFTISAMGSYWVFAPKILKEILLIFFLCGGNTSNGPVNWSCFSLSLSPHIYLSLKMKKPNKWKGNHNDFRGKRNLHIIPLELPW